MILGPISANTISRKATAAVAAVMTRSLLPKVQIASAVTSAVASALISVLAIRISESSLSVRSSSHNVVAAETLPRLARWRRRWRLAAIKAVSAMAKKAENRIRTGRASIWTHKGMASTAYERTAAVRRLGKSIRFMECGIGEEASLFDQSHNCASPEHVMQL